MHHFYIEYATRTREQNIKPRNFTKMLTCIKLRKCRKKYRMKEHKNKTSIYTLYDFSSS